MSTEYTRTERVVTLVEYHVPAKPEGLGYSYWGQLKRALREISDEIGDRLATYEDSVRIEAHDDEVVLSFEKPSAESGCSGMGHDPRSPHA